MSVLPLPDNTRVEITVYPWAIRSASGRELASEYIGVWFTKLTPFYSDILALEAEMASVITGLPKLLVILAIWEASKTIDGYLAGADCPEQNKPYFKQVRWRFATLLALAKLITNAIGVNPVMEKELGDFRIKFDTSARENVLPNIMDELKKLEPVIASGGCIGLTHGALPGAVVQGATDPYRPNSMLSRLILPSSPGSNPTRRVRHSPGYNSGSQYFPDRWGLGNEDWFLSRWRGI